MIIKYELSGDERKRLVKTISEITNSPSKYLGLPSCAYQVAGITIGKSGELNFGNEANQDELKLLERKLQEAGFEAKDSEETKIQSEEIGLTVELPREPFSEQSLENLKRLVEAKGSLIKKALEVEALPIEIDEERISFPWFKELPNPDEIKAYSLFITKLCEMAEKQKRITVKEKEVDNEKYAFRCFLLRLGFIGEEYKIHRKILLKNLSGSSAFKGGGPNESN